MKEETIAGNKLIADFMDFGVSTLHNRLVWYDYDGAHDVKYHTSWDWLMPVVEKIGKISPFNISQDYIRITDAGITYKRHPTIEAVWNGVVLYITWYNEQEKIKRINADESKYGNRAWE